MKTKKGNGNWRGGDSEYSEEFNLKLKTIIRERDDFKCQFCGDEELDRRFNCHHIDYNKKNSSTKNLILLCETCHGWSNAKRKFWGNYYRNLMREKYNYEY